MPLFDLPIKSARAPRPTERQGTSGTAIYGGYIVSNEKSPTLVGTNKYLTFSDLIVNIPIIAASVRFFAELAAKAAWRAEGPDEELNDKVLEILNGMETPWTQVIRRAVLYRFYGFSWQEWTARPMADGTIGLLDVEIRPQSTIEIWGVDPKTGDVLGVGQRSPQTGELLYIDRRKSLYLVDDTVSDSPEGLGLLRHVVEAARVLCRLEQLEGYGYEMDLRGLPIARAPIEELEDEAKKEGAPAGLVKTRIQFLEDFMRRHVKNPELGIMLDSTQHRDAAGNPTGDKKWDLSLAPGGTSSEGFTIGGSIDRKQHEIARVLGTEHLLSGSESGSLAKDRDRSKTAAMLVSSALLQIAGSVNRDLVQVIGRLNGWPEELIPKVKPEALQHRDITEVSAALRDLAVAGAPMMRSDPGYGEVLDLLGLSRPPEDMLNDVPELPRGRPDSGPTLASDPGAEDETIKEPTQ